MTAHTSVQLRGLPLAVCLVALAAAGCGENQLAFVSQPAEGISGRALGSLTVEARNSGGDLIADFQKAIRLSLHESSPPATLGGSVTRDARGGKAVFTGLTLNQAGEFVLVATSEGFTSADSAPITLAASSASQLSFSTQPATTGAGVSFPSPVAVQVLDSFGAQVDYSGPVSIGLRGIHSGVLGGALAVDAVAGLATFPDLTVTRAGSGYVLFASAPGVYGESEAFDILPGPAERIGFLSQPSHTAVGQTVQPFTVAVQDAHGNTVTDATGTVTLTLGNDPSGAVLSGSLAGTLTGGAASFPDVALDRAGAGYTLVADTAAFDAVTSLPFDYRSLRLVYTDPGAGSVRLLRTAASTDTRVVLELVASAGASGVYSAGFNLPLDRDRLRPAQTPIVAGAALNPGSGPTAAFAAALPAEGPLRGYLTSGLSQKATGPGAVTTDTDLAPGAVLYTVQLEVSGAAEPGLVFDGASLGTGVRAQLRNRAGAEIVGPAGFGFGKLEVEAY